MLVIGGGVIGASCAHFLAKAGARVQLIDKGEFGKGCSYGNSGVLTPSHLLPLCRPGMVSTVLKTFFRKNSPLQLHLRFDLDFWTWLWRFARRCNTADMLQSAKARVALLQSSRELYEQLIADGELSDCDWETGRLIQVYKSQKRFDDYAKIAQLLSEEFGVTARQLSAAELLAEEPVLRPGVCGGWAHEGAARFRPERLMQAFRRRLELQGVRIQERVELIGLEQGDHSISGVVTTAGRFDVDQVVFATGAWSRLLQDQLHVRIPIEPGKGYAITVPRPDPSPQSLLLLDERRVLVTPFSNAMRLTAFMEFAGYNSRVGTRRVKLIARGASQYLKYPITRAVQEKWTGWRPMSSDGIPLIGAIPSLRNAWMAAGHGNIGISTATATGKLLSELITGQVPHIDPEPYRLDRF